MGGRRHVLFILQFINWLLNLPVGPIEAHNLGDGWTLILLLSWLYVVAVGILLVIALGLFALRTLPRLIALLVQTITRKKLTLAQAFLELTFPADTAKSAYATEQLHILIKAQRVHANFWDRLAGLKQPYSLELVSTHDEGIRYVLEVPSHDVERIQQGLISYMPGIKIREIGDYLSSADPDNTLITELCLNSNFVLPLKEHKALKDHDPIAYLTGHMTKLAPGEMIATQIVTAPVYTSTHLLATSHASRIRATIASGERVSDELYRKLPQTIRFCLLLPLWLAGFLFRLSFALLSIFIGHDGPSLSESSNKRPLDDPYEQELANLVKAKLDQQLFEVSIRILVASDDPRRVADKTNALIAAYDTYDSPWQAIVIRKPLPLLHNKQTRRMLLRFQERKLTPNLLSYGSIVSASELSDLYHFPNTDMVKTEGLVKSRSRELAAPLSIRHSNTKLNVLVGANQHGGVVQPVGMTLEQRQKHTYVIGKTGTGKTTMLTSMIYQDMVNDKGLAVLDPHGDMFRELLAIVPEHRRKDVVVFDPSDREYPLGLNILDPGVEFTNADDRNEWTTSMVLSVFERLADEKLWGPRMEHILRSTTLTALHVPNPSLYTIQRLLTEKTYQREVAKTLKDPVLKQFWDKEFKLLGTMQMSNATAPLTHRLGHFITTKMSRHILLQEKSTLRITDIMNEGKILLVNLSKGDIGEDQSFFFGTILTSLIWMAAYQRTKISEKERRDFFLYVDEFQNFATRQFTDITSEGRKFHIPLIASHQNVAQIEDKSILKIVAGNAHALICLKAGPDDEAFILPFMEPEVKKGDIVNLAPHHFYMKTTHDESEDAFSGITIPLGAEASDLITKEVVAGSRKQYGVPLKKVEAYLEKLLAEPKKKPSRPRGGGKRKEVHEA